LTVNIATGFSTSPSTPFFLKSISFTTHCQDWDSTVLPYTRHLSFTVLSTTDIFHMSSMLKSPSLPNLFQNITKMSMPNFHWFSGITADRHTNPYLVMASHLPELQEVSFTLATGSITTSMWGEMKQIALENEGKMHLSKARKVLDVQDVVARYDIRAFLQCRSLVRVRLEYVVSEIMAPHVNATDAMRCMHGVRDILEYGFRQQGQAVDVEIRVVSWRGDGGG
jgi:hypothetical protein